MRRCFSPPQQRRIRSTFRPTHNDHAIKRRKAVTTMTTRAKSMLTIAEVLDEIDVPKSTFYRWLNTGRGPKSLKLPNGKRKIRRRDLDAWLATFENTTA